MPATQTTPLISLISISLGALAPEWYVLHWAAIYQWMLNEPHCFLWFTLTIDVRPIAEETKKGHCSPSGIDHFVIVSSLKVLLLHKRLEDFVIALCDKKLIRLWKISYRFYFPPRYPKDNLDKICWRLLAFFYWCSVLIGTVITTVDGDEKSLLSSRSPNTRYRDTGTECPVGITLQ